MYLKAPVIDSIDKTNEIQIQRALSVLSRHFGKKICILGLSFKAGTDDLRNSPFVELVESLIGRGFDLCIYDKNIQVARLTGKNKEYIEKRIPHLSHLLSDNLEETITESDIIVIGNKENEFETALKSVNGKTIIDMIRISEDLNSIRESNTYIGINW